MTFDQESKGAAYQHVSIRFWFVDRLGLTKGPQHGETRTVPKNLAFSGSNQAREGRLVNALAVRGDERRDTLR